VLFTDGNSSLLRCDTVSELSAFCWTMVLSLWGSGSLGRKLNPEERSSTIAENISNYTHHDTASHVTLHSCRP